MKRSPCPFNLAVVFVGLLSLSLLVTCQRKSKCDYVYLTENDMPGFDLATDNSVRDNYLVDSVVWFESPTNYKRATYIYDDDNHLIKRVLKGKVEEGTGVVRDIYHEDEFEYTDGLVTKITYRNFTSPYKTESVQYRRLFYDDQRQLVRSEGYGGNINYRYCNGKMVSFYLDGGEPFEENCLIYDEYGNVNRYVIYSPEISDLGEAFPGTCETMDFDCAYDRAPKPNFGIDYLFVYDPIPGTSYIGGQAGYVYEMSHNNLVRMNERHWNYTYNAEGLPETINGLTFYYRKIDK